MTTYPPQEVAARTGLSIDTLRYYERIGLIDGVSRTAGGRRVYADEHLDWLGVLTCLRRTGMPVRDMLRYADLTRWPGTEDERLRLLTDHRAAVLAQIAELREALVTIDGKIDHYRRNTMKRTLGRSGIEVSALGVGTWAIGGQILDQDGQPSGWGRVDDEESGRALRRAVDLGVTLFDTADVYGIGHSERVLGAALRSVRDEVVIATKWGHTYDEAAGRMVGTDPTPGYVRQALTRSLDRLGTDRVDLYQLHLNGMDPALADDLVAACEELADEGLIRSYGWSTDDPAGVEVFARGARCCAVQHELNVLSDAGEMLAACDSHDLASLNRSPLAMGLLSDKITADTRFSADTVRGKGYEWLAWFRDGRPAPEFLARRDAVREILASQGRTVAQGALAWCWARSPRTIPIPGCRTVAQVEENAGAMAAGPLTPEQMKEIADLLTVAG